MDIEVLLIRKETLLDERESIDKKIEMAKRGSSLIVRAHKMPSFIKII